MTATVHRQIVRAAALAAAACCAVALEAQAPKKAGGNDKRPILSHADAKRTADQAAEGKDLEATGTLDRNAVWVADRFTYTVEITCRRGVDILPDDLSREKLRLEGPEVVGIDTTREDRGNGVTRYRYAFHLTTYKIDLPVQKIGDLNIRYYVKRPGQRIEDAAPAGEVTVPGAVIALRSLLPDEAHTSVFRDAPPAQPRAALLASLQPIGIGLVIVSIVPAGLWLTLMVSRARHRQVKRSARQVRNEERESLEALSGVDLTSEAGRREAYDRVNALVRDHLRDTCGVPAEGLTAAEVGPELSSRGARASVELVTAVLAACEQARYGGDSLGSPQACRETIDRAQQVLAVR